MYCTFACGNLRSLWQMFLTVTVSSSFLYVFLIPLLTLGSTFFAVSSPHFLLLGALCLAPPVSFSFLSQSFSSANSIYFSEYIFCRRSSKWVCLWVFLSAHQVCRFLWDSCVPSKKEMEKEARKRILCFGFNSRGRGTSGDLMGKVLTITLYVLSPLVIEFSFKIPWLKFYIHSHFVSHHDFTLQFSGFFTFQFLLPATGNRVLLNLSWNLSFSF